MCKRVHITQFTLNARLHILVELVDQRGVDVDGALLAPSAAVVEPVVGVPKPRRVEICAAVKVLQLLEAAGEAVAFLTGRHVVPFQPLCAVQNRQEALQHAVVKSDAAREGDDVDEIDVHQPARFNDALVSAVYDSERPPPGSLMSEQGCLFCAQSTSFQTAQPTSRRGMPPGRGGVVTAG